MIAIIDRESQLGQEYEKSKNSDPIYRWAHFLSAESAIYELRTSGFRVTQTYQTLLESPPSPLDRYSVIEGFLVGAFVVIAATALNALDTHSPRGGMARIRA